jgi:hypothetical protein
MLFFMAHDDPHEPQNARFAVVFTRAQIQTTGPASKTDRALIQIIEAWQRSVLLGAFRDRIQRSASFNLRSSANRRTYFLRPLRRTFAAFDSFDSRVCGFAKVLPASLNCFFVGFPAISSSVNFAG